MSNHIEKDACQKIKNSISIVHYGTNYASAKFTKGRKPRSPYCPHCGLSTDKKEASKLCIHKPGKYQCFSCNAKGSIIDYVKAHKEFNEVSQVIKYLGSLYNNDSQQPTTPIIQQNNNSNDKEDKKRKAKTVKTIIERSSHATKKQIHSFLKSRSFSNLISTGIEILHKQRICINNYKDDQEFFKETDTFVFPITNNNDEVKAVQKIGATHHKKKCYGEILGYWIAKPVVEKYQEIVIVESALDALALACIGYNTVAIFSTSNTKNIGLVRKKFKNKNIYLWLDAGKYERKTTLDCIKKYSIRGVFWKPDTKKGFDIGDLLKMDCGRFSEHVQEHIQHSLPKRDKQKIKLVEPDTSNCKSISEMSNYIRNLQNENVFLFSAPTGSGKTHLYANEIVRAYCSASEEITVLTNSIKGVDNIIEKIRSAAKKQGIDNIDITRNVSDRVTEESKSNTRIGRVAITTYASLGRKGHTNIAKPGATELIKDRVLFCDEIQALIEGTCKINIPLSTRFRRDKATFRRIAKCPVKKNNPNACASCIMAYKRESPDKYNKLNYPSSFSETDIDSNVHDELITEMFDNLWDVSTYENDEGIFNKFIDNSIDYDLGEPKELDEKKEDSVIFAEFIKDLLGKLKHAQLSMVSPVIRETGKPINPTEILNIKIADRTKQVRFTEQACQVPHLKGFDILPILQMLQAKKIVMCSATIPIETKKLLDDVLQKKDWCLKFDEVNKINVTFHATFLTTEETLSQHTQVEICKNIKHKTIIAAKTRDICDRIYRGASGENVEKFSKGDFEDNGRLRKSQSSTEKDITITYLRSALLTGLDYPNKDVMIIDCLSFYPQIVCTERDKEKRKEEMIRQLQTMLIQAIGRVLRTTPEKRNLGQDDRSIVFLLHGLKYNIEIDSRLFHSQNLVREKFITDKKKHIAICNAIDEARRCVTIRDYRAIEKAENQKNANKKYLSSAKNQITKAQRKNITITKQEKKMDKLIQKANIHQGTWRQFYQNNNVNRLKKSDRKKLQQVYDNK